MKRILILMTTALSTIFATLVVIKQPLLLLAMFISVGAIIVFNLLGDNWRRCYILTLIAMTAGTSHIPAIASVGSVVKVASLGLLILSTYLTTHRKPGVYANKLHKALVNILWLIAGLSVISVIWSQDKTESATQAITFICFVYILQQVSTIRWRNRKLLACDLRAAYWTTFSILTVGVGLALISFPEAVSSISGRWQGVYNNPNLLGMMASLTTSLGVAWALHKKSWIIWISVIIPASQVVLSESRTSMIATGVALLVILVRGKKKYIVLIAYFTTLMVIIARVFNMEFNGQSFSRFTAIEDDNLLNSRTAGWNDAFIYISDHPLGIGWAATTNVLAKYRGEGIGAGLSSVHNSYLQVVYELGWVSIIPIATILIILFRVACTRPKSGLAAGLIALVLSGTFIQFTESAIFAVGQPYPYVFWLTTMACILLNTPEFHGKAEFSTHMADGLMRLPQAPSEPQRI